MMFYSFSKTQKIWATVLTFPACYLFFSVLYGLGDIMQSPGVKTYLHTLPYSWPVKLVLSGLITFLIVWAYRGNLDIAAKRVGQGQHGTAHWATEQERKAAYRKIPDGREQTPGFIIGRENHAWIVDTGDGSAMLTAPPGAGKTKRALIAGIYYNAVVNVNTKGQGASMILTDCKGELLLRCGRFLVASGYRVQALNFSEPLKSAQFNLLQNVNLNIDRYKAAEIESERLLYYGRAERYAKILSSSITDNMDNVQKSDSGSYFTETAKGLLTGMILLVSEYGDKDERHIISVFRLIIEMNGLTEDSNTAVQKNRLQELLAFVDNDRIRNYVGPATSADVRTSMNVFSSALGKLVQFIDAELEPMVCGHSEGLSEDDFIRYPTAIFLVCPDSNTTRHFFASLFIRYRMNELTERADAREDLKLERPVIAFWDEFGNMPPIKDIDVLLSAARSRGIRFLLSLQSYAQLEKNYSEKISGIIRECCQMSISTYVSPNSRKTAEEYSKVLGSKTIQSGSVTRGKGYTQNLQMMGRRLLMEDEIIQLQQGEFIIIKAGCVPLQTKLPMYWDYIADYGSYVPKDENGEPKPAVCLTADKIRMKAQSRSYRLRPGMFDR